MGVPQDTAVNQGCLAEDADRYSEPSLPPHVPVKTDAVSVRLSHTDSASPSSPSTSVPFAPVEPPAVRVISSIQLQTDFIEAEKLPGSECIESCNGPQKPLFALWPGRNRFFFNGYCITGGENDVPCCPSPSAPNICAWVCILLPSSIYFIFVFKTIFEQVHPVLPILTTFLFLLTVCSLLGACMTDPGVIPRRDVILATNGREQLNEFLGFDVLGATGNGSLDSLTQEQIEALIPQDLLDKGYRWCNTCKIIRPPRSSHCSYCDNCVMRFDHHCPFVNNCVGQRNYHFFFAFVSSVGCLSLFVLPSIGWWLINGAGDNDEKTTLTWVQYPLYVMLGVVCLAACLLLGLWGYHTFLLYTGQTTREHLAGKRATNVDRDPTICAKRGPKLFNPRALVVEGDFLKKKRPLWGSNRRTFGDEYYHNSAKRKDSKGSTSDTHDVENPEGPRLVSDFPSRSLS